jgi:hypothetical protein
VRSFGRGVLAYVTTGAKKLPALLLMEREEPLEKGALNGSEVMALCDILRVMRLGRAKILVGRVVNAFWERSSVVSALRSAKDFGNAISLFL